MARHPVHRIIFFARGSAETADSSCFAFTCPRGDSEEASIFQCHVFRCEIPEAVTRVMNCFVQAFRKPEPSVAGSDISVSPLENTSHQITFELTLEIREEDSKSNFTAVQKDRNYFKIRAGIEKKIFITVLQVNDTSNLELPIERCFGLLVSPGRNVKHSDMHLLEMVSMGINTSTLPEKKSAYVISGHWDPNELVFGILNRESSKEINSVYMTIAVDLVIRVIFVVKTFYHFTLC